VRKALVIFPAVVAAIIAAGAPGATAVRASDPSASGRVPLTVLVEPNAGLRPIYRLITGAYSSVDLTMYELNDPTAEADLAADAHRGVNVRVLLDQNLERSRNAAAYNYLASHGVHVHWAPAGTTYHQKTLTIDDTTSAVMTLNLVQSDYAGTRDFVVVDTNRADVAAIAATFDADFAGRSIAPPEGTDLVWSPTNAESSVLAIIENAKHTLAVENEEMSDPAVISALAAAAHRDVHVEITMTADPEWNQALQELAQAGAHVRLYANSSNTLYIHAKAIVADAGRSDQEVLVGSQNFSVASLNYNRELGILTSDPAVVSVVAATLAFDYAHASASASSALVTSPAPAAGPATCMATASVYKAADDENNVYVHSNQPHQEATAKADGHIGNYETDGSGYAVIYLNGPPAGAKVTVTVGSATCTTRV
jgi:phosphatidylserine/phosphatidylglycerophosphate/cardiolipin synthase-like enzyme